jgi:anti-anti-sigma factor
VSGEAGVSVIRLDGELEIGRKDELARLLQLKGTESSVLVDCSSVTYADSTALAELLRFRADAQARAVSLAVLIESRQFARIVQYAGLAEAFAIFENRPDALAYLSRGRTA